MPIRPLFPTFLYQERLLSIARGARGRSFNDEILRETHILREVDEAGVEWSEVYYPGGYTSYASMNDLHRSSPVFEQLRKRIDAHVRRFIRHLELDLQGGALKMSDCWVNIMPAGAHHSGHIHPLSVISGTYYVSSPRGSGSLRLEDPRLGLKMAAPPAQRNCTFKNKRSVTVSPRPGTVVLFESWLRHEVPANTGRGERVSVSFNYEWT